jgi:hypothetical protein
MGFSEVSLKVARAGLCGFPTYRWGNTRILPSSAIVPVLRIRVPHTRILNRISQLRGI